MNPQGSQIIDTTYFTASTAAVNAASTCAELQLIATEALTSLKALEAGVQAQLALLAPMLALLTAPTNPGAVITWIQTFITSYLTPQLVAYTTYTAKLAALVTQMANLTAAITAKAGSIPGCSITLP
jgi:hypothetical protein